MKMSRFIRAWSVGTVFYIALHIVLHRVLLLNFFDTHLHSHVSEEQLIPFSVLVLTLTPLIITILYCRWTREGNPFWEGFTIGALVGLLISTHRNFIFLQYMELSPTLAAVDIPLHIIEEGVVGILIALAYGFEKRVDIRA